MRNKYIINPVDCAVKAYFLGFIACDGSLYNEGNKLQLEINDESVIKLFSEVMDTKYVSYDKYDKRTGNTYHGFRLYKCIEDIINIYGGRKKPDRHIPYDIIPPEYLSFLVQGIFDADGTLRATVVTNNRIDVNIQVASSYNIITDLYYIVKQCIGIEGKIHNEGSYYGYYIYDKYNFVKFLQWIYKYNWFVPLPRKYEKAMSIIQTILSMNKAHLIPEIAPSFLNHHYKPFTFKPIILN